MAAHWQVAMVNDHQQLVFAGGVNEGAADALEQAIFSKLGTVHTLVLDSPGGWIGEGRRMAEVVKEHKLNTHFEQECMSACTLLAGHERSVLTR